MATVEPSADPPMNLAEKLSREIARVRGVLANYEQAARMPVASPFIVVPIRAMRQDIERACAASGRGDIEEMIRAVSVLEGWTE